jgi:hypothetical protein
MRYTIPPSMVWAMVPIQRDDRAHASGRRKHSRRVRRRRSVAQLVTPAPSDAPHLFDNRKGKVAAQIYIVVERI